MRPSSIRSLMGYRLVTRRRITYPNTTKAQRWKATADSLRLSKEARGRLAWMLWYQAHGENALATARHFSIAPKTFHKWRRRFDSKNFLSLETRSRAPKRTRTRNIAVLQESRIIELRKAHIRWGKMKLQTLYRQAYGEPVSSWKIQYTIQRYKLYYNPIKAFRMAQKRKRSQAKKRITELKRQPFPGFLIALDAIVKYGSGFKRYILTAIDTVSKIAFARMYTNKTSRTAADFLGRMVYLLDGGVLNTLNDNGSEFHKEYITACQKLNIQQYWSRVRTPKDNPMNERFNRTLQEEFLALGNFQADTVVFNQKLTEWLIEYNFQRPHQALGYSTPFAYYQEAAKVLPMYPSRT